MRSNILAILANRSSADLADVAFPRSYNALQLQTLQPLVYPLLTIYVAVLSF
jgi:hypothetical protein